MSEQEKVQDYVKKSHNVKGNKPKSEKNTQDVQKKCSSLTEKWNGEIKDYWYYYTESGIEQAHYCEVNGIKELVIPDIDEVLAPVPSYETHLTMKDCAKMVFEAAERETKLKELLKECRIHLSSFSTIYKNLLRQIDEVLNDENI